MYLIVQLSMLLQFMGTPVKQCYKLDES